MTRVTESKLGRKAVWTSVAARIGGIGWTGLMIGGPGMSANLTLVAVFLNLALYGTLAFVFGAIGLVFELPLRMRVATLLGAAARLTERRLRRDGSMRLLRRRVSLDSGRSPAV